MENQAGLERGMTLLGPLDSGATKYLWTVTRVHRKSVNMIALADMALMEANITTPSDMSNWTDWSVVRYVDGAGLVTEPFPEVLGEEPPV